MTISSIELYVAFQKLFKTEKPTKQQVLQMGVQNDEFDAIDMDHNEYLDIDEALRDQSVSELLYSCMASTYGTGEANKVKKNYEATSKGSSNMVINIDPSKAMGNNPFV